MKRCIHYFMTASLVFACLSTNINLARAFGVRDQGQIFATEGIVELGTDNWSQSITTGIWGQLVGIQILIENWWLDPPLGEDFDFSVFDGGNPPAGSPLFSQQLTITRADFDEEELYTWDVSSANLFFDVGDIFTFALSTQEDGYRLSGNDPYGNHPGYVGGELFKNGIPSTEPKDMAFITYVVPVPVPAAVWLLGGGLIGLVGLRRRYKK